MKKSLWLSLSLSVVLCAAPFEIFAAEPSVPAAGKTVSAKKTTSKKRSSAKAVFLTENAKTPAAQREALVARLGVNEPGGVAFKLVKGMKGFELRPAGTKITILAGNDNDLIGGYGYYLRNVLKKEISWSASRYGAGVPAKDFRGVKIASPWEWRYAYNYCTLSYTSAFWGKKEWAEEIDRMALCGTNYMLVQAGLEKVWQLTLNELGYPKESLAKFIPAPAFAAWWNMGNLEGHGGPLSQKQIDAEAALGKFIVRRMENYGITPILQGFTGLVPHDFKTCKNIQKFNPKLIGQGNWVAGFKRPDLLDPTNAAFPKVAEIWYKNLKKVYGYEGKRVPAAFGGDLFHEGGNAAGVSVPAAAKAVQTAQQKAAPGAVWVLQAWHNSPRKELVEALDKDKTMVLALCKDLAAGTRTPRSFWGAPWLWCELSNFGGNHGMYGSMRALGDLGKIGKAPKMSGIGVIPEGTEVNPFFYDLFFDRIWMPADKVMSAEEIDAWIGDFVLRRYGKSGARLKSAWQLLERSVYRPDKSQEGCTESILCATPSRNAVKASTWSTANVYWNGADVQTAFEKLVAEGLADPELAGTSTFNWDLCDVGRQFLSDLARPLLKKMMADFDNKDTAAFDKSSKEFLALISETDRLLATHKLWRFGRICEQAKAKGAGKKEQDQMLRNAKMLVTTWSEKSSSLENYSHRQLAGLMKDCYLPRWKAFVDAHKSALAGNDTRGNVSRLSEKITHEWRDDPKKTYTSKPEGKTIEVAAKILERFAPLGKELFGVPANNDLPWTLSEGGKILEFDVTDVITSAGTFRAVFKKTSGTTGMDFSTLKLYEDDKVIDSVSANNSGTYNFKVEKLREGLGSYTLKVERKTDKAQSCSGTLRFEIQK